VRILTIHSAKGLESRVVVLMDANHSDPARDDIGILCDWPQDATAPTHFSAFARAAERGAARDQLFAAEDAFKMQEDWNLLYVAATRAKELLIVSGVASRKSASDGMDDGSWYARLQVESTPLIERELNNDVVQVEEHFVLATFDPPSLALPPAEKVARFDDNAIEEGIALHALLERLTHADGWPITVPGVDVVAHWLACTRRLATIVRAHAEVILAQPKLERFFNPMLFRRACNEMDIVFEGKLLRFDRVVQFDDTVWILDYKRDVLESERAKYQLQLASYRRAAQAVYVDSKIKAALITVDGRLWEYAE
jgi:ATP-dependent helicase/nuclease subunit A